MFCQYFVLQFAGTPFPKSPSSERDLNSPTSLAGMSTTASTVW
ncbi:hypothetical protein NRB20_35390 [Nocardia sp. RB20]|uniref:Uncharacterized protein n=1 Tax=Nocardia macrotermitis TaxID=2585198 RepID=A0A7K0D6H2_9NOCA|nr:hypothetical protein [Nocardia macrotermitis]